MSMHERQEGIIHPDTLNQHRLAIVGVGATGRQVALQLAVMGAHKLTLIDPQEVEEVNCGAQGYRPDHVGLNKVDATGKDLDAIVPQNRGDIWEVAQLVHENYIANASIVFCCLDNMNGRAWLWRRTRDQFLIDSRILGTAMQIYCVYPQSFGPRTWYREETLFTDDEAEAGRCTARTTFFAANIAAGYMVSQAVNYLTNWPVSRKWALDTRAV